MHKLLLVSKGAAGVTGSGFITLAALLPTVVHISKLFDATEQPLIMNLEIINNPSINIFPCKGMRQ